MDRSEGLLVSSVVFVCTRFECSFSSEPKIELVSNKELVNVTVKTLDRNITNQLMPHSITIKDLVKQFTPSG